MAIPVGVGWWVGLQKRDDLILVDLTNNDSGELWCPRGSHVFRVIAVRVAYNVLEVVMPVVPEARKYFPPWWTARDRAPHTQNARCGLLRKARVIRKIKLN